MATYKSSNGSSVPSRPTRPDSTFKLNCEPTVVVEEKCEAKARTRIGRGRQEASRPQLFCINDLPPPVIEPKCEVKAKTQIGRGSREQSVPHIYCRSDGKESIVLESQDCCTKVGPRDPTRPHVFYRKEVTEEVEAKQECCKKIGARDPTRPHVFYRKEVVEEPLKQHSCCRPTAPTRRKKLNDSIKNCGCKH